MTRCAGSDMRALLGGGCYFVKFRGRLLWTSVLATGLMLFGGAGCGCRDDVKPVEPPPESVSSVAAEPVAAPTPATANVFPGVRGKDNGVVVLNLAASTNMAPPFVVVEDKKAADGRAIAIPGGSGKDKGHFEMPFILNQGGDYAVWVRAFWEDGCGNSVRLGIDEQPPIRVTDSTYGVWHWVQARFSRTSPAASLTAGPHRLRLWNREDGIRVDQVLLAPWDDDEFMRIVPQGIE